FSPDAEGRICCPECGRTFLMRRALRDGGRFRLIRLGTLLAGISVGLGFTSVIRNGAWPGALPSLPLVVLSYSSHGTFRTDIREEITNRVDNGEINGLSGRLLAEAVVRELRDDDTHWNAEAAISLLESLWPESRHALEQELRVGDGQSRVVAAEILRSQLKVPTPLLLEASVRQLHDDRNAPGWYLREGNARRAVHYLITWHRPARSFVISALDSNDPQQRMFAAVVAAYARYGNCEEKVTAILAWHLQDNEVSGDAGLAARALYEFGSAGIPSMKLWLDHEDPQVRKVIASIIERIEYPDREWNECVNRMPRLTSKTHDPLGLELQAWFDGLYIPHDLTLD
ncbi:MAG: hypothetical protein MK085_11475, partial [Phycisphaerales bacterium]|nr:hypothetical protein [Phycisphaerales bacterium]